MKTKVISIISLLLMAVTGAWAQATEDIIISPTNGDIAAALTAATEGKQVGNITINLTENGEYTIGSTIVIPNSIIINGNGATIDANSLTGNFIQLAAGASSLIEYVVINSTKIMGLKKALFYSTETEHLINMLSIDNCIIEVAANVVSIDFTKGSAARNVSIENSTIYAPIATTYSFYSSQSGQKLTYFDDYGTQTFTINSCTMYNLAMTKNFFTHRQNNQKWEAYIATNSIFVNCGKSGATIIGINGGSANTNPTWTINGNAFNFMVNNVMTDTSASEQTGDTNDDEKVQNSVTGIVVFADAENGDFTLGDCAAKTEMIGDTRWILDTQYNVTIKDGTADADQWTISPSTAEEGATVTISYTGNKHVKSIKAVKKAATVAARPAAEATAEDLGKIVGADGNIYDSIDAAETAGTTAVAMIAYIGSDTDNATYTHGLALALSDENGSMDWNTALSTCESKTAVTDAAWLLPSKNQWNAMFTANGGNAESYNGIDSAITTAGGTVLENFNIYWSSTEDSYGHPWNAFTCMGSVTWQSSTKNESYFVRACLAF